MTTEDKVKKLMAKSNFHAVFVAQCVIDRAKNILENKEEFLKEQSGQLISAEVWIECSEDAKELLGS